MKRYRYFNCAGFQGIDEASDGDYVAYDDAKQLEQDNVQQAQTIKELQAELSEYKAKELGFIQTLYTMTEEKKELRAQIEDLQGINEHLLKSNDALNTQLEVLGVKERLSYLQSLSAIRNEAIREGWRKGIDAALNRIASIAKASNACTLDGDEADQVPAMIDYIYDQTIKIPYPQLAEDE